MIVLGKMQINAVYATLSIGCTTREMHGLLLVHRLYSFIAALNLNDLTEPCYKIGNKIAKVQTPFWFWRF